MKMRSLIFAFLLLPLLLADLALSDHHVSGNPATTSEESWRTGPKLNYFVRAGGGGGRGGGSSGGGRGGGSRGGGRSSGGRGGGRSSGGKKEGKQRGSTPTRRAGTLGTNAGGSDAQNRGTSESSGVSSLTMFAVLNPWFTFAAVASLLMKYFI